jgi:hypothetical protein
VAQVTPGISVPAVRAIARRVPCSADRHSKTDGERAERLADAFLAEIEARYS